MKIASKIAVLALIVGGTFAADIPEAYAWACQATARDGTVGYSYNYPNRRSARRRALNECQRLTYHDCYIYACQPNG